MNLTTKILLDTTVYGTPSGNYDGSSQNFYGDPVTAANYYAGQGSLQTAVIRVEGFTGDIRLEATLNDNPVQALWFEVAQYGDLSSILTETHPINIDGNFTYMRVRVVEFDAGTINSITLTY